MPDLERNQPVLVQDPHIKRSWKPGVVIDKSGPNDFKVQVQDTVYRRNRSFLKPRRVEAENQIEIKETEVETKNRSGGSKEKTPKPMLTPPKQTDSGITTRYGRKITAPHRLNI